MAYLCGCFIVSIEWHSRGQEFDPLRLHQIKGQEWLIFAVLGLFDFRYYFEKLLEIIDNYSSLLRCCYVFFWKIIPVKRSQMELSD